MQGVNNAVNTGVVFLQAVCTRHALNSVYTRRKCDKTPIQPAVYNYNGNISSDMSACLCQNGSEISPDSELP